MITGPRPNVHGVAPKFVGGVEERGVYLVNSDSAGTLPWTVNMEAFDGFGECNCPSFNLSKKGAFTKRRKLELGQRTPDCACKHLERAHFFNSIRWNHMLQSEMKRRTPRYQSDAHKNT